MSDLFITIVCVYGAVVFMYLGKLNFHIFRKYKQGLELKKSGSGVSIVHGIKQNDGKVVGDGRLTARSVRSL